MNDKIITVRMPVKLINDLELLIKEDSFMDLSEALRSIIRRRSFYYYQLINKNEKEEKKKIKENKKELLRKISDLLEVIE